MESKKINQLATEMSPAASDLTIIGDPITGVSKKITLEQISSLFAGSVSFYTNLASFPLVGSIDTIYCAKDTNKLYLWNGSAYVQTFPSQALLDTYQLRSEKGASNGYASLDSLGKVPIAQLPSSIMEYKGTWSATTNTPTLANGTGDTGDLYICNGAGSVNFGAGAITFAVGDYVVYSGSIWQRSSGAVGTVTSVGLSTNGNSVTIGSSPVTTSGTISANFVGDSTQYINGAGNLTTFPTLLSSDNLIKLVRNNSGATMTAGTIVYINGALGNKPTIAKALATGDSTSAQTYGLLQTDIANNADGYVVVIGNVNNLDTSALTEGQQLYLSGTTAGTYTTTKPYAPTHLVYVGIVLRAHPTMGIIGVKIQNGYELDEIHDVQIVSVANGNILQYDSATSLWKNVAGSTTNIIEGTRLYYTDTRVRAALSFIAGSGAYNSTTGVITIPTNNNQITNGSNYITLTSLSFAAGSGAYNSTTGVITIPTNNTQITNGANYITLASLSAGAGISYNNTTGVITSTITQYTDALARASISLTTSGTIGAATYNSTTGVLNIPQYADAYVGTVTSVGLSAPTGFSVSGSPVTSSGTLALAFASGYSLPTNVKQSNWDDAYTWVAAFPTQTGNNGKYLTTNGSALSWADNPLGTVTSVAMTVPTGLSVSGSPITTSGTLGVTFAAGYSIPTNASQTNWDTAYTNRITSLTTTGASGSATLVSNVLNVPTYTLAGLGGISLTSLSATTPLSYNNTTGAFSIQVANTSQSGYLSSTDWNTFNNKQSALTNPVTGTGTTNYLPKFTGASTIGNSLIYDNGTNVGIGTALPSYKLDVSGESRIIGNSADGSGRILLSSKASIGALEGQYNDGTILWQIRSYGGPLRFGTDNAQSLQFYTNGITNPRLTIDASGNLGLGCTSVYSKLQVRAEDTGNTYPSTASINISNYEAAAFGRTMGVNFSVGVGNTTEFISGVYGVYTNYGTSVGGALAFITNNGSGSFAEKMRITSSGRLLIGTASEASYMLDVNGTGRFSNSVTFAGGVYNYIGTNRFFAAASGSINYLYTGSSSLTILNQGDTATLFTLANSGAATFSSSVNATSLYTSGTLDVGMTPAPFWNARFRDYSDGSGVYIGSVATGGYKFIAGDSYYNNSGYFYSNNTVSSVISLQSGNFVVYTNSGLTANTNFTPTERLRIASTGAATFSSTILASSTITAGTTAGGTLYAGTVAAYQGVFNYDASGYTTTTISNTYDNANAAINFKLRTAGTSVTAMTILGSGNVGIGTSSPNAMLDVYTSQGGSTIAASHGTGGSYPKASGIVFGAVSTALTVSNNGGTTVFFGGAGIYANNTAASNNTTDLLFWTTSGGTPATRLTIASTGAATFTSSVTATSFFESSDSRLKTLIQDNYQTKGIASITPKLYTKNGKVELGYYAQDFVGILDSAVSKGSDDMLSLSYREVLVAKVYALEQRIKELENK
jgi:hypothetical protein